MVGEFGGAPGKKDVVSVLALYVKKSLILMDE